MSGNEWWRIERGKVKCTLKELTGNAGSQDEGSFLKEQLKKAVRKGTSLYFYIFLILLVL